jgi:hypothetical protein
LGFKLAVAVAVDEVSGMGCLWISILVVATLGTTDDFQIRIRPNFDHA